jgi:hypothetical protein
MINYEVAPETLASRVPVGTDLLPRSDFSSWTRERELVAPVMVALIARLAYNEPYEIAPVRRVHAAPGGSSTHGAAGGSVRPRPVN